MSDLPSAWPDAVFAEIGGQKVLQGDCLTLLRCMPAACIDVIVTSPPYNIGVAYGRHCDRMAEDAYLGWLDEVWAELHRVLKPDGSFFLNLGGAARDAGWPLRVGLAAAKRFVLQNHIVWAKSVAVGGTTHGHFKPLRSRRFLNNTHEQLFHLTKTGTVELDRLAVGVAFSDKSNIARWGHADDRRCAGNIWFIPYETVRSRAQKFHHPASFPPALPERCIRLHGRMDAVVLDPFLGIGSTLLACARLGMTGIGMEIDASYCAAAAARLRTASGMATMPARSHAPAAAAYAAGPVS